MISTPLTPTLSPRSGSGRGIAYLDGRRLSRAVIAGAHFVGERAEPLNKINVFPVPDGDTGTNLAATLQKVAAGVARLSERHVRRMCGVLANEALGGARGNSGPRIFASNPFPRGTRPPRTRCSRVGTAMNTRTRSTARAIPTTDRDDADAELFEHPEVARRVRHDRHAEPMADLERSRWPCCLRGVSKT